MSAKKIAVIPPTAQFDFKTSEIVSIGSDSHPHAEEWRVHIDLLNQLAKLRVVHLSVRPGRDFACAENSQLTGRDGSLAAS